MSEKVMTYYVDGPCAFEVRTLTYNGSALDNDKEVVASFALFDHDLFVLKRDSL